MIKKTGGKAKGAVALRVWKYRTFKERIIQALVLLLGYQAVSNIFSMMFIVNWFALTNFLYLTGSARCSFEILKSETTLLKQHLHWFDSG